MNETGWRENQDSYEDIDVKSSTFLYPQKWFTSQPHTMQSLVTQTFIGQSMSNVSFIIQWETILQWSWSLGEGLPEIQIVDIFVLRPIS